MYTEMREEWENRPKCHWGRAGQLYGLIPLVPTLVRMKVYMQLIVFTTARIFYFIASCFHFSCQVQLNL